MSTGKSDKVIPQEQGQIVGSAHKQAFVDSGKKVAIVTDWILGGGAEMVTLELHKMFPHAPIYTSYCSPEWRSKLDNKVVTGYLQYWPFPTLRKFIPGLRAKYFERLNLEEFDLVISITGAEAKGIRASKPTHVSYINAPTHYYWSRYDDYIKNPGFGIFDPIARIGLKSLVKRRRKWDYRASQRPDHIIANSTHIQSEIKKYYERHSEVIFPPVDTEFFNSCEASSEHQSTRHGYVVVGRQTPYKRIDLAVEACTKFKLPLLVIGSGPEHQKLRKIAGPTIIFKTDASRDDVAHAMCSAKGFIFPGLDDFGIVAVEAMASGTPVLAYKAGGALDYVTPGKSGDFFEKQSVDSLMTALNKFEKSHYSPEGVQSVSQKFSSQNFQDSITEYFSKTIPN